MSDQTAKHAFLLAVRRLEREHGLYLETSEWMNVCQAPPRPELGVFGAADTLEETAELERLSATDASYLG